MKRVWNVVPEGSRENLPFSFRSQAGLVHLANRLFSPVFGSSCALKPRKKSEPAGIERWLLSSKNKAQDSAAFTVGIAQLIEEGWNRRDIAVLVRTNADGERFASALAGIGIPSVMELPGLLSTRECALVLAGLRVVADRYDSLAAVTILHLLAEPNNETPAWLGERLRAVNELESEDEFKNQLSSGKPWPQNATLSALESIDDRMLPPSAVVESVIEVLELGHLIRKWGEVPRRGSHLDNLLALAEQYETECREVGAGATLTGLITHFESKEQSGEDYILPPEGIDAVRVLTYHKSKGLEWPVVVLTGLEFARDPNLWEPIAYGGAPESGKPLDGRKLRFWSWPFGRSFFGSLTKGSGLAADALATPEGQEMLCLDEEESQRLLYVGFTRAKRKLVLVHRQQKYRWLSLIPDIDAVLDLTLGEGEHDLDEFDTSLVIRELDPDQAGTYVRTRLETTVWLSEHRVSPDETVSATLRFHNPSQVAPRDEDMNVSIEDLPGEHSFPARLKDENYEAIGNALHAYYASLPSLKQLDEEDRKAVALRCLKGFGMEGTLQPGALVASGERLRAWVDQNYPGAIWQTEVPVSAPRNGGGQWNGTIDLLLTLEDERVVIIDHKSAPIPKSIAASHAAEFTGQLSAYAEILQTQSIEIAETWIHLPIAGVVARLEIP
jgi:ATP-dependent exoDNAse (exonuclease V) beta subunit